MRKRSLRCNTILVIKKGNNKINILIRCYKTSFNCNNLYIIEYIKYKVFFGYK